MTHTGITASTRHLTASMVVIDVPARRVLLVDHKASGKLVFPGGHIDADETPHEAAVREVLEETGIRPTIAGQSPVEITGMVWLPSPWMTFEIPAPAKPDRGAGKPAEPAHSHIDLLYIGEASSDGQPDAALEEVNVAAWFDITDLNRHNVRADVAGLTWAAFRHLADSPARRAGVSMVSVVGDGGSSVQIGGVYDGGNYSRY